jgi:hypothetical protein
MHLLKKYFSLSPPLPLSLSEELTFIGCLVVEPKLISKTYRLPQEMPVTAQKLSMKLTLSFVFVSGIYIVLMNGKNAFRQRWHYSSANSSRSGTCFV